MDFLDGQDGGARRCNWHRVQSGGSMRTLISHFGRALTFAPELPALCQVDGAIIV